MKNRNLKVDAVKHLRSWRESAGLSRPQVADKINAAFPERDYPIDQATIAKWEKGESAARAMDLVMLAKAFGCPEPGLLLSSPADRGRLYLLMQFNKTLLRCTPEFIDKMRRDAEQHINAQMIRPRRK